MPDLPIIVDVAIGVVFVFLLMSLLVTWVQELLASFLNLRSKHLANVLQNLLDPSAGRLDGVKRLETRWSEGNEGSLASRLRENATKAFYEHPLVKALSKPNRLPSYIASRDFGVALFDSLMRAGTETSPGARGVDALRKGIDQLGNPSSKAALLSLVESLEVSEAKTEEKLAAARKSIESWFDRSMDRAQGWYRVESNKLAIVVGLLLVGLFNADGLGIAQTLWRDASLRDTLIAASTAYIEQDQDDRAVDVREQLQELGLPIGWSFQFEDFDPATPADARDFPVSPYGWLMKVIGLLVTGYAISQGSALWFDSLKGFVNMRLVGKKPDSKAEADAGDL